MNASDNEHVRFEALHSALAYALQKTLSKFTLKVLISCYPDIDHTALEYIRKQIIKSWQTRAEIEFQKIFNERGLKVKLDSLDDIIRGAERRRQLQGEDSGDSLDNGKNIDLSSLTPSELAKVFIISEKEHTLQELKSQLNTIYESNQKLVTELGEIRNQINDNISFSKPVIEELRLLDSFDEEDQEMKFKEMVEWAVTELASSN